MGANTVAATTTIPGYPEEVHGFTAKPNDKVKGDAGSDDQKKAEMDQPPCQGNVAEYPVIEEQDR